MACGLFGLSLCGDPAAQTASPDTPPPRFPAAAPQWLS